MHTFWPLKAIAHDEERTIQADCDIHEENLSNLEHRLVAKFLKGHIAFRPEQASPTSDANANSNTSYGLHFETSYSEETLFQYIGTFDKDMIQICKCPPEYGLCWSCEHSCF